MIKKVFKCKVKSFNNEIIILIKLLIYYTKLNLLFFFII